MFSFCAATLAYGFLDRNLRMSLLTGTFALQSFSQREDGSLPDDMRGRSAGLLPHMASVSLLMFSFEERSGNSEPRSTGERLPEGKRGLPSASLPVPSLEHAFEDRCENSLGCSTGDLTPGVGGNLYWSRSI